ncbi:MAG: hypothetical protein HND51_03015 [Chloroflexi bacterium]|nr:hypothetical protein [Chloroflexota bacterium]NOH10593.1 hypothetical protein [Chloroflexota bacterium]
MLAIIQMAFLPGFLLLRVILPRQGFICTLVFSFALSLIFNYCVVALLTTFGIYYDWLIYVVIAAEVILLLRLFPFWLWSFDEIWLAIHKSFSKVGAAIQTQRNAWRSSVQKLDDPDQRKQAVNELSQKLILLLAFLIAVYTLVWAIQIGIKNLGTVFQTYDAIVSWNPWAIAWAGNAFPVGTWQYPQLIPTNWSLTYVLIGSIQVQFFAKAIMPLFTLFMLLLLFQLGLERKKAGYFIAMLALLFILRKFLLIYIPDGYVDLPVTFFGFAAVYTLLVSSKLQEDGQQARYLLLGALLAAGSAVTKQAGIYILVLYPLLAYLMVIRPSTSESKSTLWKNLGGGFGLALAIVLPWYIYVRSRINAGLAESEVPWVTEGIYKGATLPERFINGMRSLEEYILLFIFVLVALLWLGRKQRILVISIIIPFTVLWGFYFSYSPRNLALVFPFLALAVGLGFDRILERIRFDRLRGYVLLVLLVVLMLLGTRYFPAERMLEQNIEQQGELFYSGVNQQVYDYLEETGFSQQIITDYPLGFLPDLEGLQVAERFEDYDSYVRKRSNHPHVDLILLPRTAHSKIIEEINHQIELGNYELLFEHFHYRFIKVVEQDY